MKSNNSWICNLCGENYHKNFQYRIIIDKETLAELKVCEECRPDLFEEENDK